QGGSGLAQEAPEQGQLDHRRQPEPEGKERVPDLHLHVRDPAVEERQGGRDEEVRRLGADEGPDVRPEAALRPADAARPEGGPQAALAGPLVGRSSWKEARNVEPAATTAAGFDIPTRGLDHVLDDRQAEPGAARGAGTVGAEEALEQPRDVLVGDAGAVVRDL